MQWCMKARKRLLSTATLENRVVSYRCSHLVLGISVEGRCKRHVALSLHSANLHQKHGCATHQSARTSPSHHCRSHWAGRWQRVRPNIQGHRLRYTHCQGAQGRGSQSCRWWAAAGCLCILQEPTEPHTDFRCSEPHGFKA